MRSRWPGICRRNSRNCCRPVAQSNAKVRRRPPAALPFGSGRFRPGQPGAGVRAQGYFDGAVSFAIVDVADAPPANMVRRGRAVGDATRSSCLRFDVVPRDRATTSAPSRGAGATIPTAYKPPPKALGLVAGEPALPRRSSTPSRSFSTMPARLASRWRSSASARPSSITRPARWTLPCIWTRAGSGLRRGRASPAPTASRPTSCAPASRSNLAKPYDTKRIEEGQNNLFDTDLFSTIVPRPATSSRAEQQLDVAFDLSNGRRGRSAPRSTTRPISAPAPGCSGSTAISSARASGSASRPRARGPAGVDQQA